MCSMQSKHGIVKFLLDDYSSMFKNFICSNAGNREHLTVCHKHAYEMKMKMRYFEVLFLRRTHNTEQPSRG